MAKTTKSQCRMCGKCCHYEIPVTLLDIHRIAKHLNVPDQEAFAEYIQDEASTRSGLFMIHKKEQEACVFLTEDNKCAIHKVKPRACSFYVCTPKSSSQEVLPWTATCSDQSSRARLWEQSIASAMTKAYIKNNGATWNNAEYHKAILAIYDNVVTTDRQKIKLAGNGHGIPLAMIYDCSQCEKRGSWAKETPITLDDISRITRRTGLSWKAFFREKIDPQPSISTGGLRMKRETHCVFFDPERHCTVEEVRPMHCRFNPCPQRVKTAEMFDCFFLGSGTVEEQFRHQVALAITRQYVTECGTRYNKDVVRKLLKSIEYFASDHAELKAFCQTIAPYRYVDDTLLVLQQQGQT